MEISWLGWFKLPKPGQPTGHLILEFTSPNHANAAIDESLVIGSSLRPVECILEHARSSSALTARITVTIRHNVSTR